MRTPGPLLGEVLRFGVVGVAATLVHTATLVLLVEGLGVMPALANALAFLAGVNVSYFGNALWVFSARGHAPRQILRFAVTVAAGFLGHGGVMALATEGFGWHYAAGLLAALVLVPAMTFALNKFWVFRAAEHRA